MTTPSTTESRNPRSTHIDQLSTPEMVAIMNAEDATVAAAVQIVLPEVARAIDATAARMKLGGRLIYVGAGTSGRLGVLDASECPPTFGSLPESVIGLIAGGAAALQRSTEGAEDDLAGALPELRRLVVCERDVLCGISASGRTPFVLGAVRHTRGLKALTLCISCNLESPLSNEVDVAITPVVGPEIITGSTRLKAGTATKMVLNMLSTGTMIRLGRVAGNLMVDLNPACDKLKDRAAQIVATFSGLGQTAAASLLEQCGGETRTAIVAAARGIAPEAAREFLRRCGNDIQRALLG